MTCLSTNGVTYTTFRKASGGRPVATELTGTFWPFGNRADRLTSDKLWKNSFLGFKGRVLSRRIASGQYQTIVVQVPYYFLMCVLVALDALAVMHLRKKKNLEVGQVPCVQCGYDLRATPAQCPECGTVVTGVVTDP